MARRMELLLLLSAGLSLAGALWPSPNAPALGFRPEQVVGFWHTLQLGATEPSAVKEGGAYRCYMSDIKLLENGNLNVTYYHRKDGVCQQEFYIGVKTDTPGRYIFNYDGINILTFIAAGHDYVIMDLEKLRDGDSLVVVELHGRSPSVSKEGVKFYRWHTHRRGIWEDSIEDLSDGPRCPESPES